MAVIFNEQYPEARASFNIEISRILFSEKSPYQKIEILESPFFGRLLVIDNNIMLTEKDEFIYHEMISHVPLYVHPHPSRILIIGGGDGGTIREVIKHDMVEQIVLVDIGLPDDNNPVGRFWARLWESMGDFLYDIPDMMREAGLEVSVTDEFGPGNHIRAVVGIKAGKSQEE